MSREDTSAPKEPMLGFDRRYYHTRAKADEAKANLEAAGYVVQYEFYANARWTPHKLTFWLDKDERKRYNKGNQN